MITINADTKIAKILKEHPDALEAIVSISPMFNKLRNPLLRKLMASRTSIGMASKIGGCEVNDFFEKLKPLGFIIDNSVGAESQTNVVDEPDFVKQLTPENTVELDVRPILDSGKDPLSLIMEKVSGMPAHYTLKLINSFVPTPLIQLLEKRGFESYSNIEGKDLVYSYFFKSDKVKDTKVEKKEASESWDTLLEKYEGKLKTVDVRELEMPLPMLTILDALDNLPESDALYVYHKRIPVFLLPELQERKFDYRTKEISDGEVHLLIFKA